MKKTLLLILFTCSAIHAMDKHDHQTSNLSNDDSFWNALPLLNEAAYPISNEYCTGNNRPSFLDFATDEWQNCSIKPYFQEQISETEKNENHCNKNTCNVKTTYAPLALHTIMPSYSFSLGSKFRSTCKKCKKSFGQISKNKLITSIKKHTKTCRSHQKKFIIQKPTRQHNFTARCPVGSCNFMATLQNTLAASFSNVHHMLKNHVLFQHHDAEIQESNLNQCLTIESFHSKHVS